MCQSSLNTKTKVEELKFTSMQWFCPMRKLTWDGAPRIEWASLHKLDLANRCLQFRDSRFTNLSSENLVVESSLNKVIATIVWIYFEQSIPLVCQSSQVGWRIEETHEYCFTNQTCYL